MSITPGFTAEEIREFVFEYELQPFGQKSMWLAARNVSYDRFRRWRRVVFDGDLDRGLIPREASGMTTPLARGNALERQRAKDRAVHQAEVARLNARVRELEDTNAALGKAIGLLHSLNELEPAAIPDRTNPADSSTPRTTSSPS